VNTSASCTAIGNAIDDVSLRSAVERALNPYPRRIVSIRREPSPYRASCRLEQLRIRYDTGDPLDIIFKDLGFDGLSDEAKRIRPQFVYDPRREIEVYRDLLPGAPEGTPFCYGFVMDEHSERYWLFLERVAGRELYQIGDLSLWQEAARWLALLHARFTELVASAGVSARRLLRHDEAFYRRWRERALSHLGETGQDRTDSGRRLVHWLSVEYDKVIECLLTLPPTFIHGEFYASNVLLQTGEELRVCPVDWEMAALGPGLDDLAALTAGRWTDAQRTVIALAYYDVFLSTDTSWRPSVEEFLNALDCCRIHTALQWLAWAPNWTPPPEHRHDWTDDLLQVISRLGIR
jgi:hypothetical protein